MDENLIQFCIENGLPFVITFDKPWIDTSLEEYNTDTSALHSETNEDIVRPTDITNETVDLQNKESVR